MIGQQDERQNTSGLLRVFAYGTLRQGHVNHDRFCSGAIDIRSATVWGRLYDLGPYPALEVPEASILAYGAGDPRADVATQGRFEADVAQHADRLKEGRTRRGWRPVRGELITFDDPEDRLPRLDRLEGFRPGGPSLYYRLLIPIMAANEIVPAWTYVACDELIRTAGTPVNSWPRPESTL